MFPRILAILTFGLTWLATMPGWAVVVYLKNDDEPIRGFLVSENAIRIVVAELLPNGERSERVVPMAVVEDVSHAFDPERLTALSPDQPQEYRTYAEDLSVKTSDPEARAGAIQLYLIAAFLDPGELGRSCLLGMAALARTPQEERACHAMAYMLDPDHDSGLLKQPKLVASSYLTISENHRSILKRALQQLRSGQMSEARAAFRRPAVQAAKAHFAHLLSDDDYQAAIAAQGRLSDNLLRKFLIVEITLSTVATSDEAERDHELTPWSKVVARQEMTPIKSLSLKTMTEFNPRACLYKDGRWVVPASE